MPVIDHSKLETKTFPGVLHKTIAGLKQGSKTSEIWYQTSAEKSETPPHYHDCEEIIIILRGSGWAMIDGKKENFRPNSTIIVPPNIVHQMANTGKDEMLGKLMNLPWSG